MKFIPAIALVLFVSTAFVFGQSFVKRTITKTDRFDFGAGGTVSVAGAPTGSITVQPSTKNEIEITAEVEIQAANDRDLELIAKVAGFVTDETVGRTRIITVGPHNKFGQKKLPKGFPKNLTTLPFLVNYSISVPRYTDLEIDGGKGDLSISGIEGSMRVNFLDSQARIEVSSGSAIVAIGAGSLNMIFGANGWRGRMADIQVATGDLFVQLPSILSAEIDAAVLRDGVIENLVPDLKPRDRKVPFTDRSIAAKAGVGGPPMKFTVGAGRLRLSRLGTKVD